MITELITVGNNIAAFFETHQGMDGVMAAWLAREFVTVKNAQPYIQSQGGLGRVVMNFFWVPGFNKQIDTKENEKDKTASGNIATGAPTAQ